MVLMEHRETFEDLVIEAIQRAGGIRPLTRIFMAGGLKMHNSQVINMRDGLSRPKVEVPNALAYKWPDLAARMYEALGVLIPEPEPDLVDGFRAIAKERGIPVSEVASALVNEELKRMGKK